MATFIKRRGPDGRWVWQARVRKRGHPQRTHTFDLKTHAVAWAQKVEREMEAGVAHAHDDRAERTLLADALTRYEREILPTLRGASSEVARLRRLRDRLGHYSLAALGTSDVAEYRDARVREGAAAQTVTHELGLLNRVLRASVVDWGIALPGGLPTALVRKPSLPRGRDRRLLPGEEPRLLAACAAYGGPIESIVVIALSTAMRRGEIAAMRWEHLDREARVLLVPETKTGVPRRVPLSSKALAVLDALPRNVDGYVWVARFGSVGQPKASAMKGRRGAGENPDSRMLVGLRSDSISQAFGRLMKRAREGYEIECRATGRSPDPRMLMGLRFHDLRHEATSRLFERGLNPMEVSSITGHKTLQMLKRYTHLRAEDLVDRLG